jgi:hypothetical protein
MGFSASPSSAVAKGGGAVSVGVASTGIAPVGAVVLVDVAGAKLIRGILQLASRVAIMTTEIINGIIFRFTLAVEIIIPP